MMHSATVLLRGHEELAQATPDTAAWLIMFFLDFSTVWTALLWIVTGSLHGCGCTARPTWQQA